MASPKEKSIAEVLLTVGTELINASIGLKEEKERNQLELQELKDALAKQQKQIEELQAKVKRLKYAPQAFRAVVAGGLKSTKSADIFAFIKSTEAEWGIRRYRSELWATLIAHSFSQPDSDIEEIKIFEMVFNDLMTEYKCLKEIFEREMELAIDSIENILPIQRKNLARITALCIGSGSLSPSILMKVISESLVVQYIALGFLLEVCLTLKQEKSSAKMVECLKKGGIHEQLVSFFPKNTQANDVCRLFRKKHLEEVAALQDMQKALSELSKIAYTIHDQPEDANIRKFLELAQDANIQNRDIWSVIWTVHMTVVSPTRLAVHEKLFTQLLKENADDCSLIMIVHEFCSKNPDYNRAFLDIIQTLLKKNIVTEKGIETWMDNEDWSEEEKSYLLEMLRD